MKITITTKVYALCRTESEFILVSLLSNLGGGDTSVYVSFCCTTKTIVVMRTDNLTRIYMSAA